MKKKIISYLIVFLIGGLIFGSIGTVLALTYKASDIVYTPSDTSWNVSTVGEAINSLALSKTSDNYSAEEQVVGTWIDGKPIYQKTFTTFNDSTANNGFKNTFLKSIIPNLSEIIECRGLFKNNSNGVYYSSNLLTAVDKTYILTAAYGVQNITYTAITIKYTKTTD